MPEIIEAATMLDMAKRGSKIKGARIHNARANSTGRRLMHVKMHAPTVKLFDSICKSMGGMRRADASRIMLKKHASEILAEAAANKVRMFDDPEAVYGSEEEKFPISLYFNDEERASLTSVSEALKLDSENAAMRYIIRRHHASLAK